MPRSGAETREHILRIANDLFYWDGIRATGIDRVAAEAGVAPTTLYRLFSSKDDLVAAYVERSGGRFRTWFTEAVNQAEPDPRDQLLAVFDALTLQVQPQDCRGCAFLMTLAEFPDPTLPGHQHAVATKAWVRERLGALTRQLAAAGRIDDPETLGDDLTLVMEGAYASVQALGVDGPARRVRGLAESLIDTATARHASGREVTAPA